MKKEQIDILKEVFEEWLQIHELDYDFCIYNGDEWRARGEDVLHKAVAVLAFENQLVSVLNYAAPSSIMSELQDLAGEFGYYFEMGHHWNIGFYPLEKVEALPSHSAPYSQLLRHSRWKAKRQRILSRGGGRCEECGDEGQQLDVHHCYYRFGRLPWQYPDGALLALCRDCHATRGKAELRFRMFMTRVRVDTLAQFRKDYRAQTDVA